MGCHFSVVLAGNGVARLVCTFFKHASALDKIIRIWHRSARRAGKLARHFDRQFEDFSVLQKSIVLELESHGFDSPDVFRSEMGTLAVHEVLRAKASGLNDVAGANVFDSNGVLINSSQRWPVADVRISDRAYFNKLKNDPELLEEVEVVFGRFSPAKAIVFARRITGPRGEFLGRIVAGA